MTWTATERDQLEPTSGTLALVQDLLNTAPATKPDLPTTVSAGRASGPAVRGRPQNHGSDRGRHLESVPDRVHDVRHRTRVSEDV